MYILKDMQLNEAQKEYLYINNAHDKIFRKVLDNKNDAVQIINRVLKKEDRITKEEIEKYKSSYVSSNLKNSEADIVYKIKNKDVFFLIEHQTKIDYEMPYRILKYEIDIIESTLENRKYKTKKYKYPIVIPIVLYTGKRKWNAKIDLREAQLKWKDYKVMELSRYNILDINKIQNDELLKQKDIISKLMIIEKSKTKNEFKENLIKILKELEDNKEKYEKEERELLLKSIRAIVSENIQNKETKEILKKIDIREDEEIMQVVEMLRKEMNKDRARARKLGLKEGIKEGIEQGIEKGRLEVKIEIIKNMINNNFSIDAISSILGLKDTEINEIKKNEINEA